jgi:hypothetical protein
MSHREATLCHFYTRRQSHWSRIARRYRASRSVTALSSSHQAPTIWKLTRTRGATATPAVPGPAASLAWRPGISKPLRRRVRSDHLARVSQRTNSRNGQRRSRRSSRRSRRRPTPWATTAAPPTTAAVRATGRPITPGRPARARIKGISDSLFGDGCFGLERGDDGLDWDPAVRDQLATGPTGR